MVQFYWLVSEQKILSRDDTIKYKTFSLSRHGITTTNPAIKFGL